MLFSVSASLPPPPPPTNNNPLPLLPADQSPFGTMLATVAAAFSPASLASSSSSSAPSSFAAAASAAICPLVHKLYGQSPALRLLFLAQSIGSALSLVALAYGMLQVCTSSRQPPLQLPLGTLLMVLNLCIAMLMANIGVLLSSLYHLHVPLLRAPSTHCYWLSFTLPDCLMIRTIVNVSLFATYTAGTCLALERMAGSLLLIRRTETRQAIAVFLAVLQWLLSMFAAIPPALSNTSSTLMSPHCSLLTPSPTQLRPLFFAVLGMQAFVLAIYSILTYHNHFDHQTIRELARHNPVVLEQVYATEHSLPAAASVVGLFLASTFLDRNFLMALATLFTGQNSSNYIVEGGGGHPPSQTDDVFRTAFWSEFQTLAIPLMSLLLVTVLQLQMNFQRAADEDIYERVVGAGRTASAAAATVVAVRKVPSAIGGGCVGGEGSGDEEEEEKQKTTSSSGTSGGGNGAIDHHHPYYQQQKEQKKSDNNNQQQQSSPNGSSSNSSTTSSSTGSSSPASNNKNEGRNATKGGGRANKNDAVVVGAKGNEEGKSVLTTLTNIIKPRILDG